MSKLLEQLTDLDKKRIENFISLYGCDLQDFTGFDRYFAPWAKNNTKLFHVLGNNLSVSVPFHYEKSIEELELRCEKLYDHPLYHLLRDYIYDIDIPQGWMLRDELFSRRTMAANTISSTYKLEVRAFNKVLSIQKGMKAMKIINKIVNFNPEHWENFVRNRMNEKEFEKFGIKNEKDLVTNFINMHSTILNDKHIDCTLTISIHPLDFMTMSDNASDWESCMSWVADGCYHTGTVEMMNSNCVLCCFLHNPESEYNFSSPNHPLYKNREKEKGEEWIWNNKRYRQLVYITKDIIASGKAYPYMNDDVSKKIIDEVRKLAEANMSWDYSFGPERYLDMKWINGSLSMNRSKEYARKHSAEKHNIIFETNTMYNDFVRDSSMHYWCFRNIVPHTKVINASGPAPCLICNDTIVEECSYQEDYFDRYEVTDSTVCSYCKPKVYCLNCDKPALGAEKIKFKNLSKDGLEETFCVDCANQSIKSCWCCGQNFKIGYFPEDSVVLRYRDEEITWDDYDEISYVRYEKIILKAKGVAIPVCKLCKAKKAREGIIKTLQLKERRWGGVRSVDVFTETYPLDTDEQLLAEYNKRHEEGYANTGTYFDF